MGKASSSKKVARAAKAAGRPGAKKNYTWPVAIGAVVVLGVVLVVMSFGGTSEAVAPKVGDHWHAAYGVYDCNAYKAPFTDKAEDATGIHTHGEGLMHMHPFTSRVSGKGANIDAFLDDVGAKVTDSSFEADRIGMKVKNGQKCDGKAAHLELWTWTSPADDKPKVVTNDIGKFAPQNGNIWAIAFVPDGTKPTMPQSVVNLQDPTATEEGRQPAVHGSSTTLPANATTTIPASDAPSTTEPAPSTTAAP